MNSSGSPQASRRRRLWIIFTVSIAVVMVISLFLINPLEQIRRFQDRRLERGAGEFLEAADYYYKDFFEYPWDVLGQADPIGDAVQSAWLQEFIDKEVVASGFAKRSCWDGVFVTYQEGILYACFAPLSEEFKEVAILQGRERDGSLGCTQDCFICPLRSE
jgi:hypothetical protein